MKQDWPDAYYGLALTKIRLGNYTEAVSNIELAVKWSGKNLGAHILYVRALCHRGNKDLQAAQKFYKVIMRGREDQDDFRAMLKKQNEIIDKTKGLDEVNVSAYKIDIFSQFTMHQLLPTFKRDYGPNLW